MQTKVVFLVEWLGREGIVMLLCRVVVTVVVAAGTYCQQREVEAITEGVEDDDGEWTVDSGGWMVSGTICHLPCVPQTPSVLS